MYMTATLNCHDKHKCSSNSKLKNTTKIPKKHRKDFDGPRG